MPRPRTTDNAGCCALYMRLSREDDKGTESASIETQRKILHRFAREQNFPICNEYVDDGYSGTDFERPAFRRLLQDIENGKVAVLLIKDLSRLGRNNGRVSILLDEYLPRHRVRCISVTENYDSTRRSASASIITPVHNFVNELYAADISLKIHAALDIKMQQGEYIGAFAPYGYRKDPGNKNHLIIDPEAAATVKYIFALAQEGYSPAQIAAELNEKHIPTPSEYRSLRYNSRQNAAAHTVRLWQRSNVSKLLRNETYLGHTVQGKTNKPSFKSKYVYSKPREEWIITHNTHQAIIDSEIWDIVRKKMQSRTAKRDKGFVNIFSGLAKCADCGKNMSTAGTRKKHSQANLNCGGYKLGGSSKCTNHTIDYDTLYQAVLTAIRQQIHLSEEEKQHILTDMLSEAGHYAAPPINALEKQLAAINGKLVQLFDDRYSGLIENAQFATLHQRFTKAKAELSEKLRFVREQQTAQNSVEEISECSLKFQKLIAEYDDLQTLTPELLFKLIDRINVHQGEYINGIKHQQIDIIFKFRCKPRNITITAGKAPETPPPGTGKSDLSDDV